MIATNHGPGILFAFLSFGVLGQSTAGQAPDAVDMSGYILAGSNISDEPSLFKKCNGEYSAFRYIEIVASSPIGIIRVENEDGAPNLTRRDFKIRNAPETLERRLSLEQWNKLVTAFQQSGFWAADSDPTVWMPDSLSWIFEACHHGTFHQLRLYPERDFTMNHVAQILVETTQ